MSNPESAFSQGQRGMRLLAALLIFLASCLAAQTTQAAATSQHASADTARADLADRQQALIARAQERQARLREAREVRHPLLVPSGREPESVGDAAREPAPEAEQAGAALELVIAHPAADKIRAEVREAAERHGMQESLLYSVIRHESAFDPEAVSPKGAQGLMQLMPGTASDLGVLDAQDPAQNIAAGARYLAQMHDRFSCWHLALAAYNAGPERVRSHAGIPPFEETQQYVKRVLKDWALLGGEVPEAAAYRVAKRGELHEADIADEPARVPPLMVHFIPAQSTHYRLGR